MEEEGARFWLGQARALALAAAVHTPFTGQDSGSAQERCKEVWEEGPLFGQHVHPVEGEAQVSGGRHTLSARSTRVQN